MFAENDIQQIAGADVHGTDDKIGRAGQVFLDDKAGRPEWATVNTGLLGTNESFVPLAQAELRDQGVTLPFIRAALKDALNVDPEGGAPFPRRGAGSVRARRARLLRSTLGFWSAGRPDNGGRPPRRHSGRLRSRKLTVPGCAAASSPNSRASPFLSPAKRCGPSESPSRRPTVVRRSPAGHL